MKNLLIGCIFLFVGLDLFFHPVFQSSKCGGCIVDIRPYHYLIGPILGGFGAYFISKIKT